MKVIVCASMDFAKEMIELKTQLEQLGHDPILPKETHNQLENPQKKAGKDEKIEGDFIKGYYEKIKDSDALLVFNKTKKGIENYIGGNTLIEMAFGHVLNKPCYLYNPIPKEVSYTDEIEAMQPVVLDGDLQLII